MTTMLKLVLVIGLELADTVISLADEVIDSAARQFRFCTRLCRRARRPTANTEGSDPGVRSRDQTLGSVPSANA
jgi:hypothetical protein